LEKFKKILPSPAAFASSTLADAASFNSPAKYSKLEND
jgi:hypothetical protein